MTEDAITAKLDALKGDETVNLAPTTRRTYDSLWAGFTAWCAANGFEALPASPSAVVGHLLQRYEDGMAATTLPTIRNAIASRHKLNGLPRPTDHEDVKTCLRLLKRKARVEGKGTAKQAPGLRLEHIVRIEGDRPLPGELDPAMSPDFRPKWTAADERRHAMDCAVVTVMHSAFLRTAEAAALRWGDIAFRANGQALVTIRSSKTSAEPETALLTTRAVGWLRRIMPRNPDMNARVFGVRSGRSLHDRIVRACKHIRPGATGHSPRVGAAQDMTIRGGSLQQVKEAGRWKSLAMPAYYASQVKAQRGGVNLFEDE